MGIHYSDYPDWIHSDYEQGIFIVQREFYSYIPVKFEVDGKFTLTFSTSKEVGYSYISKILINGKSIFKGSRPVSYFKRFSFKYDVKAGEVYNIEVYRKLFSLKGFIKKFFIRKTYKE